MKRKILRAKARFNMEKEGLTNLNKEYDGYPSYFSKYWRNYC